MRKYKDHVTLASHDDGEVVLHGTALNTFVDNDGAHRLGFEEAHGATT
jgi:hypothetical protein